MDPLSKELYRQATALFDEGNYREAEPLLKNILKLTPDYPDILNKLGVIMSLKGHKEDAVNYFQRALSKNPLYTEASLNLAITYNEMNEFKKAQEVIAKAAQIASPEPYTVDPYVSGKLANEHFRIGNIYLDFGMFAEAVEEYKKALRLHRGLVDVRTKLGIALRNLKMFDEAVSQFTMAKELNPDYGPARVQLGLTYYMQGSSGLAMQEWEEALRENPELKEAQTYLKLLKEKE
jgi:tetratricopeptide (TPR) repeat protein